MLRFQYIEYFIVLAIIPLIVALYFVVLRWKKKTISKIGDERLVMEMIKSYSPQKFALKFILIVFAFACCVLALANLRSRSGIEKVSRNGIDVMIALDVSKSMLAQDIMPNRLERAKQLLGKLFDKVSNNRIGIVVFAGRAYLQMPLTGDHSAAKMYLSAATTDAIPTQGTVVADALQLCYTSFNSKEKKYKAVILISDGEDHEEGAMKIAEKMAAEGIVINTVGIGSPEGSLIIDPSTNEVKKDEQGNEVITKLNEKELINIAAKGNGIYQLYSNSDEVVSSLVTQLNSMDQRTVTQDSLVNYKYHFQWFLLAALILLMLEMVLSEKVTISSKRKAGYLQRAFLLILAVCLFPKISSAQNENSLIKKGNDLYANKEYQKAIKNYEQASLKNPASTTAQYNLGNALYKNMQPEEAVSAYENAVVHANSKTDKAKSFYNKGVVLQNNKKIPECIAAYKEALRLSPDDEDARQNLQKALQQQKQQQQKEKKDKEQKKPTKDEQQKDQKKPTSEDKNDQPKPQPSKLSKEDAEEKLKALLEQEKNLQNKLRRVNAGSPSKPEKDW